MTSRANRKKIAGRHLLANRGGPGGLRANTSGGGFPADRGGPWAKTGGRSLLAKRGDLWASEDGDRLLIDGGAGGHQRTGEGSLSLWAGMLHRPLCFSSIHTDIFDPPFTVSALFPF